MGVMLNDDVYMCLYVLDLGFLLGKLQPIKNEEQIICVFEVIWDSKSFNLKNR